MVEPPRHRIHRTHSGLRPRRSRSAPPLLLLLTLAALLLAPPLHAQELPMLSPRALGLGGALRGAAAGTAALSLNPSGISLNRSYVLEGSYQYFRGLDGHVASAAVTDSTSGFNLGGGLYYTYATASPEGAGPLAERGRHEGGAALSFPIGEKVTVGGTLRYLRIHRKVGPSGPTEKQVNGFTFDAGLTLRPVPFVSLGLVGRGLRDLEDPMAPRILGGGLALTPLSELVVTFDVVNHQYLEGRRIDRWLFAGGAEYTFSNLVSLRLGGGKSDESEDGFASLGASVLSGVGALDLGAQLDLSGEGDTLIFGVAGRLFVPAP